VLTYLSLAPGGIKTALITGGLAPVTKGCSAEAVYSALYQKVILQVMSGIKVDSTAEHPLGRMSPFA
jgi:hypothetical protein